MAGVMEYNVIDKYVVKAVCTTPMHIGNASGDKESVLVHPVDDIPFIQASSIAGAFRACHREMNLGKEGEIYGNSSEDTESRVRFTDGFFYGEKENEMSVKLELRPRVSIDRKTGSCLSAQVKGTSKNSGQKFNMEYIGAGSGFEFSVYLYGDISENQDETCEYNEYLCKVLAAAKNEKLIFGGQKSNGCGDFEIKEIWHKQFNMLDADDRKRWAKEDKLVNSDYDDSDAFIQKISTLTDKLKSNTAYEITVTGNTEGELLVKSIATAGYGADAPDAENIRNAKGEYIIPGSSVKGAFRSQMEKIAGYINAYEKDAIINNIFGCVADDTDGGKVGNIRFYDTVIGKAEDNEKVHNAARIHIDKFTGGVIQGGLFSEKNTYGDITLRISIENKNNPEATLGLLVFALRDLAIGSMSLGSGYSVGKGFIDVKKIEIQKNGDIPSSVSIEFKNEENSGLEIDNDLIKEAIAALNGFKGGAE